MNANVPIIKNLEDAGYQLGGSIGVPAFGLPLSAGAEFNIIPDDFNHCYLGFTRSIGFGTPRGELHVEWGQTITLKQTQFNIYDEARKFIKNYGMVGVRIIKKVVSVMLLILFFGGNQAVYAMDTKFDTEKINNNELLNSLNMSLVTAYNDTNKISCFDISSDGKIALGFNLSLSNQGLINIYDSNGIFEYGYLFDKMGSFGVEWDDNNMIIYLVRSGAAISVDKNANIIETEKIINNSSNDSYWNKIFFSTERTQGYYNYKVQNNLGALNILCSDYMQLVKINSLGEEVILYDVTSGQIPKLLFYSFLILAFVWLVILGVVKQLKRLRTQGNGERQK